MPKHARTTYGRPSMPRWATRRGGLSEDGRSTVTRWFLRFAAVGLAAVIVFLAAKAGEGSVNSAVVSGLGLGSAGLFAASFFPRPWRIMFVVCVTSVVSGAYLAEVFIALNTDHDDRAATLQKHRTDVPTAVASVFPSELLVHNPSPSVRLTGETGEPILPLAGLSNRSIVQCIEHGRDDFGWIIEDSDSRGFNNPKGVWRQHDVDIVLVGDSFAYGECVPRAKSIAGIIRNAGFNVLNLGMSGNGPLLELAGLVEYGQRVGPKLVVWLYYRNDIQNLVETQEVSFLRRYLEDARFHQNLWDRQDEIDAVLFRHHEELLVRALENNTDDRWIDRVWDIVLLRHLRTRLAFAMISDSNDHEVTDATLPATFSPILERAKALTEAWGGEMVFVYLPAYIEVIAEDERSLMLRKTVLGMADALGLSVVDLGPHFSTSPAGESLWQCEKCHYSAAGYAFAGELISAALTEILPDAESVSE